MNLIIYTEDERRVVAGMIAAIDRALAAKVERQTTPYTIQWETAEGAGAQALVVNAASQEEAIRICEQKAYEQHIKERCCKAWVHDPVTDGDVQHG